MAETKSLNNIDMCAIIDKCLSYDGDLDMSYDGKKFTLKLIQGGSKPEVSIETLPEPNGNEHYNTEKPNKKDLELSESVANAIAAEAEASELLLSDPTRYFEMKARGEIE